MSSTQLNHMLEHVRSAHHELRTTCRQVGLQESNARLRRLIEYIGDHEAAYNSSLRHYQKEVEAKDVLDTWLPSDSEKTIGEAFHDLDLHTGMTVEAIIHQIMSFETKLVIFYRNLADSSASLPVRKVLDDLVKMEEANERVYARLLQEWKE
ncbi:hypothetical protein GC197_00130 [bacterium]|nr:hypothetical protein [bacterium]